MKGLSDSLPPFYREKMNRAVDNTAEARAQRRSQREVLRLTKAISDEKEGLVNTRFGTFPKQALEERGFSAAYAKKL